MKLHKFNLISLPLLLSHFFVYGQTPSQQQMPNDKTTPEVNNKSTSLGDNILPNISIINEDVKNALDKTKLKLKSGQEETKDQNQPIIADQNMPSVEKQNTQVPKIPASDYQPPVLLGGSQQVQEVQEPSTNLFYDRADGIRVYSANILKKAKKETDTLPSNSIALATVMGGIFVSPDEIRRLSVSLDYTWLGPNNSVMEMSGCRLWLNASADINNNRIRAESTTMTCVASNGNVFEVPLKSYLYNADDEYEGAKATLIMNGKGKMAALMFLQGGVEAFGKAMSFAQQQSQTTSASQYGPQQQSVNIAGDQNKYMAGQTIAGATGKFLNWFQDYYAKLSPSLALENGRKIFLIIDGSVQIPKIFFKNKLSITVSDVNQFVEVANTNREKNYITPNDQIKTPNNNKEKSN